MNNFAFIIIILPRLAVASKLELFDDTIERSRVTFTANGKTSDSGSEFLKIENVLLDTVQNNYYRPN